VSLLSFREAARNDIDNDIDSKDALHIILGLEMCNLHVTCRRYTFAFPNRRICGIIAPFLRSRART